MGNGCDNINDNNSNNNCFCCISRTSSNSDTICSSITEYDGKATMVTACDETTVVIRDVCFARVVACVFVCLFDPLRKDNEMVCYCCWD